VLLLCAGEDKIVSPKAIREFSSNMNGNVTFIEYPDAYHQLHLDLISDEVLGTMLSFLRKPALLEKTGRYC
jgi:alpha-beta hydrolase superfamily lysophospholipase